MIINKPVVIFDIETTGLDIINDQIIDISLIKLDLDSSEKIKQYKINPANKILIISSLILFYSIPILFNKSISKIFKKNMIVDKLIVASLLFLIMASFFNYSVDYTGGGIFFKFSPVPNNIISNFDV